MHVVDKMPGLCLWQLFVDEGMYVLIETANYILWFPEQ